MDALDKASFDDLERRACRIREDSEREELLNFRRFQAAQTARFR